MSRKEIRRLKRTAATAASTKGGSSAPDLSPQVHQGPRLDFSLDIRERSDLTERQQVILEASLDKATRCVMIDGVWGTGKTMLTVLAALKLLNAGRVKQILYVRNPVEASANSKLGFIPGTVGEKMAPYNAVLNEKLEELLPKPQVDRLIKDGWIECIPTGYLQGRSFNCTAIIVDEAASMSWDDLMLLISRCGPFTRIYLVGDTINQLYLRGESGFARFFRCFDDAECRDNGVYAFELKEPGDIVRSGFVRFCLRKAGVIKE
jgi:phosphate starvation-inducible protein PhoH and related proteins